MLRAHALPRTVQATFRSSAGCSAPRCLCAGPAAARCAWSSDEGSDPPQDPGHVLLAALGPLIRPGAIDATRHDHYGLERTLADGFGLRALAHARTAPALTSIWR